MEVVFFHAPWCGGCKVLAPVFEQVKEQLKNEGCFTFKDIDVETKEGVDLSVKYTVRNVPTILILRKGKLLKRISGTYNKNQIVSEIKNCKR